MPSNTTHTHRLRMISEIAPETTLHHHLATVLSAKEGVQWVEITHGSNEFGRDLVAAFDDPFGGTKYIGVVVKLGKITGAATGQSVSTVVTQVLQALRNPFIVPQLKTTVRLDRVIVVCTGTFSGNARQEIQSAAQQGIIASVDFWDQNVLLQQFEKYYPAFFERVPSQMVRYAREIEGSYRASSHRLQRLNVSGAGGLEIDDLYVEPTIYPLDSQRFSSKGSRVGLGPTRIVLNYRTSPLTNQVDLTNPGQSTIVFGDPGSGKTTALRRAASILCQRYLSEPEKSALPLFIQAADLVKALDSTGDEKAKFFESMPMCKNSMTFEQLCQELDTHAAILFVDGLDEIPIKKEGEAIAFLSDMRRHYGKMAIVCSARLNSLHRWQAIAGFRHAVILPMSYNAIKTLVAKIVGKKKQSVQILKQLIESGLTKTLPSTPLIITILALLHQKERSEEVIANVSDLYDMVMQVYLGRWSVDNLERADSLDVYTARVQVLKQIAYTLHSEHSTQMATTRYRVIARQYLEERGQEQIYDRVVDSLLSDGCVIGICERHDVDVDGGEQISFSHLSFQEYFTARYFDDHRELVPELVSNISKPWWGQVLIFTSGLRKDVPAILEQIVTQREYDNPLMSLSACLTLGGVLQAASSTPIDKKTKGVRFGAELLASFYVGYSNYGQSLPSAIRDHFTRLQMVTALGLVFGLAYSSHYLAKSTTAAFGELVAEFGSATDDRRFLLGLELLGVAVARAARGDWGGIDDFIIAAKAYDLPLLQGAAIMLESLPHDSKDGRWDSAVRAIRRFAPEGGITALQKLPNKLVPISMTGLPGKISTE